MPAPLVTIVISVYQRLHYLREALPSALNQTFRDFEIIVSDDGPSEEIARFVASHHDPRIRYRHNGGNIGIAMNHYAAFQEARGKYLTNLDDDDVWEPDLLAELVPPLEADPTVSIAFCDHHLIDAEGRLLREQTEINTRFYRRHEITPGRHQPFLKMALVNESIPIAMGAVFRKSILEKGDYPARIGGSYDFWLTYLVVKNNAASYYVPRRLCRYRIHADSGSLTRGSKNLLDAIYVRSRFLNDPALAPLHRKLSNSLGVFYGKLALRYWRKSYFRRAWILEKKALTLLNRPKNIVGLLKNTALRLLAAFWK